MIDLQTLAPSLAIARHRHAEAYLALVVEGGYDEAGSGGRFRAEAGDLVVHLPYEAHLDHVDRRGARVINLVAALPPADLRGGVGAAPDVDAAIRLARRDPVAAAQALLDGWRPRAAAMIDWPDLLADALDRPDDFALEAWAARHDLAPATVSRGFRRAFGVTPVAFRAEARARRAWHSLVRTRASLADVALAAGFADQAHMTRAIRALTGRPPGAWRA
jgi:AraC-like DNA-binding protein